MREPITSFEIPALSFERAVSFYTAVLGQQVTREQIGGEDGGRLPRADGAVIGIIRCSPQHMMPSDHGVNVYLRVDDLDAAIAQVEQNGGKVVVPKMDAGEMGQFAWILDSEGNRVGLNQPNL
jgi:predicted enzyme related to lactoylglutathione lyase